MKKQSYVPPKRDPEPCPSAVQIQKSREYLNKWKLHYYQLLYFHEPKLTMPQGGIFTVEWDEHFFLSVRYNLDKSLSFGIGYGGSLSPEESDQDVIRKCGMILEAIKTKKVKVDYRACCILAEISPCVCAISFSCPLHGGIHIGTHD
jgi:hypothetical protein